MEQFLKEANQIQLEESQLKVKRIPKQLHSPLEPISESDIEQLKIERENAAIYLQSLKKYILELNTLRSANEIDHKIQKFSSIFCEG